MNIPSSLTVLGAGPAGYPAAFLAADRGLPVTLIDAWPDMGGTCLHRGCIPSKALLHAARLLTDARAAADMGLDFSAPAIRLDALRAWKESVTARLAEGLARLAKARGITRLQARAEFAAPDRLTLIPPDGHTMAFPFEALLVATGSRPSVPVGWPEPPALWTSTEALALPCVPETLLVAGGGYIGLELGSVYAALGSRVTVVEMTGGLLPGADRDLIVPLAKAVRARFHSVRLNTRVADLQATDNGFSAVLEDVKTGVLSRESFTRVLVAAGRVPDAARLNPVAADLRTSPRGFLETDPDGRTSNPRIRAAGDVAGGPMLAHKATHEAEARMTAWLNGADVPAAALPPVPAVVFTDPEIAWCGLTETLAKEQQIPVKTAKFHWAASGRALTLNRPDGFTKVVTHAESGRLLGVAMVGAGAGDLIGEAALALAAELPPAELARAIHPHPTLSETLGEAAALAMGRSAHRAPSRAH